MLVNHEIPESSIPELSRLLTDGIVGFYTHVEITEIFMVIDGQQNPVNVFVIIVAEHREIDILKNPTYLNTKPIRLKSLKGHTFGIKQYSKPISDLLPAIEQLAMTKEWRLSGDLLRNGKLIPIPPQFVPPDASAHVPLNAVLKNNFWNGSHLFEWSDREKSLLQALFDKPERLQELSISLQTYIHLKLASLSDRLGNYLIQLPVTVLMNKFCLQGKNGLLLDVAWHPQATPRELLASCSMEFDGIVSGYNLSPIQSPQTILPMPSGRGLLRGVIWDGHHNVVLSATSPTSFINSICLQLQISQPEPRIFEIRQENGNILPQRISLSSQLVESLVGESESDANGGWTTKRIYADEKSRLAKERRFVQYKPTPGQRQSEHENALNDLRLLINQYGKKGAWLWDPFLSGQDILETLFQCKYFGSDLRALTNGRDIPNNNLISETGQSFVERQRNTLLSSNGNYQGLCLEYRIKRGSAGWNFHDRFLIFPNVADRALAWSLGSSVNSVGKAHHILQQVDDGQLVMDAFLELWSLLDQPEHLIWKKP